MIALQKVNFGKSKKKWEAKIDVHFWSSMKICLAHTQKKRKKKTKQNKKN